MITNPRPENDDDLRIDPGAGPAVDWVCYYWHLYVSAKTPLEQADMLIELNNKMGDLYSWVPGYNDSNGEIERGED